MAPRRRVAAETGTPALDGTAVQVRGYLVPVATQGDRVTEFLLVPDVGACSHAQLPPPNQVVWLRVERVPAPGDSVVVLQGLAVGHRVGAPGDVERRLAALGKRHGRPVEREPRLVDDAGDPRLDEDIGIVGQRRHEGYADIERRERVPAPGDSVVVRPSAPPRRVSICERAIGGTINHAIAISAAPAPRA